MADLCSTGDVAQWLGVDDNEDDTTFGWCVTAASQWVRTHCGRSFNVDAAQVASARYFHATAPYLALVDDCYDSATVVVATDDDDSGSWSTVWASTDFQLNPVGNIGPTGETGWPYTKIVAVEGRLFPCGARTGLKVTAKWGWSALPGDVFTAAIMVASEMHKAKSGGFEVFTADGQFTPTRRNFVVRDLLNPYRTRRANDARFLVG